MATTIATVPSTFRRVYLSFQSYEPKRMNIALKRVHSALSLVKNLKVYSQRPMPTKITKHSIQSSPFIDKKAHDTFELNRHRRLIVIEGDETVTKGVIKYITENLDAVCACKITEHQYLPASEFYSMTTTSLLPYLTKE